MSASSSSDTARSTPTASPTDTLSGSATPTDSGTITTTGISGSGSGSGSPLSSSPTSTDGNAASGTPNPGGLGPPSSSLYLFTFLATLFLLLAISSAIIMRGVFLRRRFRRRIEEAIAAGVLLTPTDDGMGGLGVGRVPRRKLQRPKLFDVSVAPPTFSSSSPQDGCWEKLMPFSGCVHSEKLEAKDSSAAFDTPEAATSPRPGHRQTSRTLLERAGYLIPRSHLHRSPSSAPTIPGSGAVSDASPTPAIPLEQQDPVQRAAEVRVAVVIAMPNPHRSAYLPPALDAEMLQLAPGGKGKARSLDGWGDEHEDEAGVPDVIFGLTRVPVINPSQDPGEHEQ